MFDRVFLKYTHSSELISADSVHSGMLTELTYSIGMKHADQVQQFLTEIQDLSGNVDEWCQDWFDEEYYSSSPLSDPEGPEQATNRVIRGGSWLSRAGNRASRKLNPAKNRAMATITPC